MDDFLRKTMKIVSMLEKDPKISKQNRLFRRKISTFTEKDLKMKFTI